jgi:hypothetical protein
MLIGYVVFFMYYVWVLFNIFGLGGSYYSSGVGLGGKWFMEMRMTLNIRYEPFGKTHNHLVRWVVTTSATS